MREQTHNTFDSISTLKFEIEWRVHRTIDIVILSKILDFVVNETKSWWQNESSCSDENCRVKPKLALTEWFGGEQKREWFKWNAAIRYGYLFIYSSVFFSHSLNQQKENEMFENLFELILGLVRRSC